MSLKYQDIIKKRSSFLREKISNIKSNREKLDFLKNYYKNKTVFVCATGPRYKDNIDHIKNNFTENCLLICIKQTIKDFNMICDFHVYNNEHKENWEYNDDFKPIICFLNYGKPNENNVRPFNKFADLNFFLENLNGIKHVRKYVLLNLENDSDLLSFNDKNLGEGENMCPNKHHVIFEMCFPLSIHLGCKNIITIGWVGGQEHGTSVPNELNWDTERLKFLHERQELEWKASKLFGNYLKNNYNINLYALGYTKYFIPTIKENDLKSILSS